MITDNMYLYTDYEAPQWQKVNGSHPTLTENHTNIQIISFSGYSNK